MGGKTQQRVAGNAKPANSGRIRELLVNQTLGSGSPNKIITFSSLSSRQLPQKGSDSKSEKKTPEVDKSGSACEVSPLDHHKPEDKPNSQIVAELPTSNSSTNTNRDNYRLVVKRVGNRDLYIRVKADKFDSSEDSSGQAVNLADAGVKKPTHQLEESLVSPPLQPIEDEPTTTDNEEDVETEERSDSDSFDESDEDFEGSLDRMAVLQASSQPTIDALGDADEELIETELKILRLLKSLVSKFSRDLSIEDWDYIGKCLDRWTRWIARAEYPLTETFQANFSVKLFEFIDFLISFVQDIKNLDEEAMGDFVMLQPLLDDWSNFHTTDMFQELLVLFFKLVSLDSMPSRDDKNTLRPMIGALAMIMDEVDPKLVLSHYSILDHISPFVESDPDFKPPDGSVFCTFDEKKLKNFLAVCGLMRSSNRVILVSAHAMLTSDLRLICDAASHSLVTSQQNQEKVDDEDIPILPPYPLMSILTSRDVIVSTLLKDYRAGDTSVAIQHDTDAYGCTLSYLFAWDLVIRFIVGIEKEIAQKIIHSLKKLGLIQRLLDNIFMLLPPLGQQNSLKFRHYSSKSSSSRLSKTVRKGDQTWSLEKFLRSPLRTTIRRPLNEIELVALHLYFSVALHMPITVRKWYNNNSNKRLCNLVNEYTVNHISQVICSLEMDSVQEKCLERANQNEKTNLVIKARPSAKEVYAIYSRDEFKMELTIKLPNNYPLGAVQIDGGKRVGVTDVKWRSWLLQLTTFLAHQNGPILDGIDLWRKNIDKRFEGVEKCTICFSILHSNYQLPKKRCQTCSNMFHNLCLFKWFESSGNSTCPLCRNPW